MIKVEFNLFSPWPQLQLVLVELDRRLGIKVVSPDQLQLQLLHGAPQDDVEELEVLVVSGQDLTHQLDGDVVLHLVPLTDGGQDEVLVVRRQLGGREQDGAVKHELGQRLLVSVEKCLLHLTRREFSEESES